MSTAKHSFINDLFCPEDYIEWVRASALPPRPLSSSSDVIMSSLSESDIQKLLLDCMVDVYISYIFDVSQFLCLASFSALRVYALMDGKILVTGIVFLLNLVPVATNLFSNVTSALVMDISLGMRIPVIIGDILVLLVTWSKTAKSYYGARQLRIKSPLATLLFRDGTFYFIVLLMLNVLQVVKTNIPSLFIMEVSSPFFEILPPLIVYRFILNLRQVKPAGSSWVSGNQSGSLRFVGNAGESLRFGADEEPEEEEENAAERLAEAEEPDVVAQDIIDSGKDTTDYDIDFSGQPVSCSNLHADLFVSPLTSHPILTGSFIARLVPSNAVLQRENNGGEDSQEQFQEYPAAVRVKSEAGSH
ncbi:hypothetical protein BDY19DRAFT_995486 [Irpex rosettiformis]|uniref:Uncharacterized protein n=1 Tax=Irpex rosettiformis TaxID=378272 RepID=A0ACB8TXG8_9APHY|nr:hypothetical protein BDY19DRAFT_995486 [Irpex rosettiformis]